MQERKRATKYDYALAIGSGVAAAGLDLFWTGDLSLEEARTWGSGQAEKLVFFFAKRLGYPGEDLAAAIRTLEKAAPLAADQATATFGGGKQHHLRDFTHHPTLLGLAVSILAQFTGTALGTDTTGKLLWIKVAVEKFDNPMEKLYQGTILWMLHLISDLDGSSSTPGKGTGIPGPILSTLKEIAALPGVRGLWGKDKREHYRLSVQISKLFHGTFAAQRDEAGRLIPDSVLAFDLRTEMGLGHQVLTKQTLPVAINECIVRALYAITRFGVQMREMQPSSLDELKRLDWAQIVPVHQPALTRMLTVSSLTFTALDAAGAAIRAGVGTAEGKQVVLEVLLQINYVGMLRSCLALRNEHRANTNAAQRERTVAAPSQVDEWIQKAVQAVRSSDISRIFQNVVTCISGGVSSVNPVAMSAMVYQELERALKEYWAAVASRMEAERRSREAMEELDQLRREIALGAETYLAEHREAFQAGICIMDQGAAAQDIDRFLEGGRIIQQTLHYESLFVNQEEFDELMLSDQPFRL